MPDPFTFRLTYDRNALPTFGKNVRSQLGKAIAKIARDAEGRMKTACPVDTGFLKSSILATQVQPLLWRVTVGASYGIYVEMGTVRMRAQPFFVPTVEFMQPIFAEVVRQAIAKAAADAAGGGTSS